MEHDVVLGDHRRRCSCRVCGEQLEGLGEHGVLLSCPPLTAVQTAAKVCQGLGVGAMQFSLQMYITELSPTSKIRGMMLSCYNFWYVSYRISVIYSAPNSYPRWTLGLFIGTVAITIEHNRDPLNWRTIILSQWAQVGLMGIIYVLILPESPCNPFSDPAMDTG
jgi:MFS family permease